MADQNFIGHLIKLDMTATGDTNRISTGRVFNTVQVVKASGTAPGSFGVDVKASLDGVNWKTLTSLSTSGDLYTSQGFYRYMIFTVTSIAAGDKVTIMYSGA